MYTYDKMNSLMHQHQVKSISAMPAAIAKFEKDLKVFFDRTGETFPEVLKLPILLQMVPAAWKKEIEAQFRVPGAAKTYEALSNMVCGIGNEERYKEGRRGDDMEVDAFGKDFETNVKRYY